MVVKKNGWCQSYRHVRADTSWVTHCCLQARAAVLASYGTTATEDKDSLHVVFTQPWRLLLVLCVWKWECEVAVRLHRPKIKRRSFLVFLHIWHLLEFTLSFFPTAAPAYYACIHFPSFQFLDGIIAKEQRYSVISPTSKYWFPSVGHGFSFQ